MTIGSAPPTAFNFVCESRCLSLLFVSIFEHALLYPVVVPELVVAPPTHVTEFE